MKRRYYSVLLLFCLFAAPVGLYCYWWCNMQSVKKEVERHFMAGFDKASLVCLRIAAKDAATALHWEGEREFFYERQLYDVVDSSTSNDTLYYWCWPDKKETVLRAQMDALTADVLAQNGPHQANQQRLQDLFKSLFCASAPDAGWQLLPRHFEPQTPAKPPASFSPLFDAPPLAPPPKMV